MKFMKILLATAAVVLTTAAQAASINYEVQVAGYSGAGWIKVKPELRGLLGGRVAYLPQYGGWVTDRVARGENVRTTIAPDRAVERYCRGALVGVDAANGFFAFTGARLTYSRTQRVSTNPSFDNAYVWTITEVGYFEKRVPIGSRPR